jgi:hypothetical protein
MNSVFLRGLFIAAICLCPFFNAEAARPKKHSPKYEIAVCAIFQNEGPYLKEWIEYYRLLGVEKFYLFNNLSTDNYAEVLAPYVKSKVVNLYDWPHSNHKQKEAYSILTRYVNHKVKWLVVVDLDEYIVPVHVDTLNEFLKDYEDCSAVTISWVCFGTSDVERVPADKLMIETLNMRTPVNPRNKALCKAIVKPNKVIRWDNAHIPTFKKGAKVVNPDGERGYSYGPVRADKIRINHYWVKDEWFFWNIKLPRRVHWGDDRQALIDTYKGLNEENCDLIHKYVPELRRRMNFDS